MAIDRETASVILANCYNSETPSDCQKIHRDPRPTSSTSSRISSPTSAARVPRASTSISPTFPDQAIGNVRLNFEATVAAKVTIPRSRAARGRGKGVYDLLVHPALKFKTDLLWARAGWEAGAALHYTAASTECQKNDCSVKAVADRR